MALFQGSANGSSESTTDFRTPEEKAIFDTIEKVKRLYDTQSTRPGFVNLSYSFKANQLYFGSPTLGVVTGTDPSAFNQTNLPSSTILGVTNIQKLLMTLAVDWVIYNGIYSGSGSSDFSCPVYVTIGTLNENIFYDSPGSNKYFTPYLSFSVGNLLYRLTNAAFKFVPFTTTTELSQKTIPFRPQDGSGNYDFTANPTLFTTDQKNTLINSGLQLYAGVFVDTSGLSGPNQTFMLANQSTYLGFTLGVMFNYQGILATS